MENVGDIKSKILSIIKANGPSLPMQVARQIEKNSIITSAFLSELYSEKMIRISSMKVGGSPLYFLPGQEIMLEKFHSYLPQKEKEALALLQKNQLLKDQDQEPAIRVALRSLKDFAFPLALKQKEMRILFWHYLTLKEEDAKLRIQELVTKIKAKPVTKKIAQPITEIKPTLTLPPKSKTIKEQQKPLLEIKESKKPKEKPKSEFVNKTLALLVQQDIELLEELGFKKKEFSGLVRINTDLGKLNLFFIAKDKKKITENDLQLALSTASSMKMPALVAVSGKLNNKAKDYLEEHQNLIKTIKL